MFTSQVFQPNASAEARHWLFGRRGMLTLLGIAGIVFLGSGRYWLGSATIAPLLYLLPCAVLMAICAKGHSDDRARGASKSCGAQARKPDDRA